MATTTSTSSATFNGTSSYASDLQSVISRAISFAQLPVTLLQNQQTVLQNQQTALASLSTKFQSLNSTLSAIDSANSSGSLVATVSDNSIATATIASTAKAGTYTVNITSLGSQTSAISSASGTPVSDPSTQNIGSGSSYTLQVNGTNYTVNAGASLNSLADAINASGAAVTATVINVGGTTAPDYRLSILGRDYAPTTVHLNNSSGSDVLNTLSSGTYVTYQVNGQPSTAINSNTRALNFAAGLTVTAYQTGSTTVSVTPSSANLASALSGLASAYNSALDELTKSRGQNNGPLSGESIISTLSQTLRSIVSSGSSSGSIRSLSDLGLTYDQEGHLNFDSTVFSSAASSNAAGVANFLGSSTTGFLGSAESAIKAAVDSSTGVIAGIQHSFASQLTNLATKISDDTNRISRLQDDLTARISKADATIASLEQKKSYYTDLFAQQRANQQSGF